VSSDDDVGENEESATAAAAAFAAWTPYTLNPEP